MSIDKEYASNILKRMRYCDSTKDQISLISGVDKSQRFTIPRLLLTAASKYFAASLGPNFVEGNHDEFIMDDTDGETIQMIIDFCYTGNIGLTPQNVDKFMTIASSVQLDLLEQKCCRFYVRHLSSDNAVNTLTIADKYSMVGLRRRALNLICESFELVPSTEIQKIDHRLLHELLKRDTVDATEEMIFNRLYEWFEYSEDDRLQHMSELLKLIRLEHISPEFLTTTIEKASKRFHCPDLMYNEYRRRVASHCEEISDRRFPLRSVFCLFAQHKGEDSAEYSAIKIEKFSTKLDRLEEAAEIDLGDRRDFGMILHNSKIYVLGGRRDDNSLKIASSFDLISRKEDILPEMNSPRYDFVPISLGKYIYVFGGESDSGGMNECERFDTENNTWEVLQPMNVGRCDNSVAICNEHICVAGGYGAGDNENSVEFYNPSLNEWRELKEMNASRLNFGLVELDGYLYAIGGSEIIEKYDPRTDCWAEVGSFDDSDDITHAIQIDGQFYGIMDDGKFGRIQIDESGLCSFEQLCESKYESSSGGQHFLYQN